MAFRRRRLPDDITPEEREARIAELRARRRKRLRVLAVRSAIGTAALVLLGAALLYWLLATFGGRDFLLARIVALLPAGTELTWSSAEGPVSGTLVMRDVRYVQRGCPDVDGEPVPYGQCAKPTVLTFTAKRILLDPEITPLIGRRLRLEAMEVEGATLDLPVSDEPFEMPTWPEVLPRIDLPLSLEADAIQVDGLRVTSEGAPVIDIATIRGGLDARQGELTVKDVVVDSDRGRFTVDGSHASDDNYRTDLTASALLPAPFPRTRPRIGLVARGDLDVMDVALSGHVPDPLRAHLTLRGKRWTLRANSRALDPSLLSGSGEAGTPIAFSLEADGTGGAAELRGEFTQGTLHAVLQPSKVTLEDKVLDVQPLVVDIFDGRITAKGHGDFREPRDATFQLAVNARGLRFGGNPDAADPEPADPAPAIGVDADFGIAGRSADWTATGKATLSRDALDAIVDFEGRGDLAKVTLKTLRATMPTGTLDATGEVGWSPALRWDVDATLAGFDPGYFAPQWNGAVDGTLSSTGATRDDGGLDIDVEAAQLGGRLRGRRLAGNATFAMRGPATGQTRTDYEGEAKLTLGDSRIDASGSVRERIDIDARLEPLDLADLLPDAAGTLHGTLRAQGPRNAPDIDADLRGNGLRWRDYSASTLRAQGRLPWARGNGQLMLEGSGLQAGIALDEVQVEARGAVEDLRLTAQLRSEALGTLALDGTATRRGANWNGTLASFQLAPNTGAAWRLQAPARYAQDGGNWRLSRSCFVASDDGSLCLEADWPRRGVSFDANALPLALLEPYLPEREGGGRWVVHGAIDLEGQLRPVGNAWQGQAQLRSSGGGLRTSARARRDVIGYQQLQFDAEFTPARIEATLDTVFNDDGHVRARIATGWDATSALSGEIVAQTDELTWMELLSRDIVEPTGRLEADLSLGGTRAQPALGGQARLSNFSTEIPSLGIFLEQGDVRLLAQPDGSARVAGSVRAGEGVLNLDGSLNWRDASAPLVLDLSGENLLLAHTRDLHIVASPELELRYSAGQPLSVTGTVTVPSALIELEGLDSGASVSPDVVVLDPEDPDETGGAMALLLDLTLAMGEDVRLRGFGLDGTLGGSMRVRAQPGREMTGTGTLEVGGRYTAYGQKLQITRGRLSFDGPVSDPLLDIRAERRLDAYDITAGISVTGRASAPEATVWTDPATDDSQALSYLAFGRPLSNLSGSEGDQLDAASAALTAGGSLLAGQIGARLGLDDAGVTQSRALGGSVLGIGKQISPRLYVGFGVSLLGTGQVITLKYLLGRGFDIEIESSTVESRGSINYRRERD